MATKAEIIARLHRYDTVDTGWARRNLTGDNQQIEYLRAILALPYIQALSSDTEISFKSFLGELIRLDIDHSTIYTPAFMSGVGVSCILFRDLFPSSLTSMSGATAHDALTTGTPKEAPPYDTSDITKSMKIIRDKLLMYIIRARSQPPIISFFDGLVGRSSYAALECATGYLRIVNNALDDYERTGTVNHAINNPAHRADFGRRTTDIIMPSLRKRMDIIMNLLHFTSATFKTTEYDTTSSGEEVKGTRTYFKVAISTPAPLEIEATLACCCTRDQFDIYLENYLKKTNFSFRPQSTGANFSQSDFFEDFRQYLSLLIKEEKDSRLSKAAETSEKREHDREVVNAGP